MRLQPLQIIGKETSAFYPKTHLLTEQLDKKLRDLVIQWNVMSYGGELKIQRPNGKSIHYKGIAFDGSPALVFWDAWMVEFLSEDSLELLNKVADGASRAHYDVKQCIDEAAELLSIMANRIYDTMADVDRKLSGDGVHFGEIKNVSNYKLKFKKFITNHAKIICDQSRVELKATSPDGHQEDLIDVKPNFCGLGINLNEGWRRLKRFLFKKV